MATASAAHLEDEWPAEGAASSQSVQRAPPGGGEEEVAPVAGLRSGDGGSLAGPEDSVPLSPEAVQQWQKQLAVADFGQKLEACFRDVDHRADDAAPVCPIEEDTLLEEDP